MTEREISGDDNVGKWTEQGLGQLYGYMNAFQPTFQTRGSKDPILLAQQFQQTIDAERDEYLRKIMGEAGQETLNEIAPNQIAYRHLAILTNRLIILNEHDGQMNIDDYADTTTMVTGMFSRFAFEDAKELRHVDKDWISVKLIKPEFLYTRARKVAIGMFDADKNLISVSTNSELTIPVDAVQGRIYDPETLFQN